MLTKSYKGYWLHFNSDTNTVRVQTPDYSTLGTFKTERTAQKHVRDDIAARKVNPAPRKGATRPRRVSQITKRPPTKRLVARRTANVKPGYFPNPINEAISHVVIQRTTHDEHICYTTSLKTAEQIADLFTANADKRVLFYATKV